MCSPSKKKMYSIMNRQGFGTLKVTRNGVTVEVPSNWLFRNGKVKRRYIKEVDKLFDKADNMHIA